MVLFILFLSCFSGIVRNNSIWDAIIFNKVQKSLGGRVKIIMSGSAPIGGRVLDFLRVAFGCDVSVATNDKSIIITMCTFHYTPLSIVGD